MPGYHGPSRGGIDEPGRSFEGVEKAVIGHVEGFVGERHVEADYIGIAGQLFERCFPDISIGKSEFVPVICQDGSVEGSQQFGEGAPGVAESYDTDVLLSVRCRGLHRGSIYLALSRRCWWQFYSSG